MGFTYLGRWTAGSELAIIGFFLVVVSTTAEASAEFNNYKRSIYSRWQDSGKATLVAEWTNINWGVKTVKEYVDISLAKSAFLDQSIQGKSVTFYDGNFDLLYQYRPYQCKSGPVSDFVKLRNDKLWLRLGKAPKEGDDGVDRQVLIYGVLALWMNIAKMPLYSWTSRTDMIGSVTRTIGYEFTFSDPARAEILVIAYFSIKSSDQLDLESIQVKDKSRNIVLHSVRIIQMEFRIKQDIYPLYLTVPYGYGCHNKLATKANSGLMKLETRNWLSIIGLSMDYLLELEATAVKFMKGGQNMVRRFSETLNLQIGHTSDTSGHAQLIRKWTSSGQDIKRVLDLRYNTRYEIDLIKSSCSASHLYKIDDGVEKTLNPYLIVFQVAGVSVKFDKNTIEELMMNQDGFEVVSKTPFVNVDDISTITRNVVIKENADKYYEIVYEKTLWPRSDGRKSLFGNKMVRIVRTYLVQESRFNRLQQVQLWTFEPTAISGDNSTNKQEMNPMKFSDGDVTLLSQITFRLVAGPDTSRKELARALDIADECYLNSPGAQAGRDYAWVEITYPVSSQLVRKLRPSLASSVIGSVYRSLPVELTHSAVRVPRVEPRFDDDDKLVIRLLLLDVPKLTTIFDAYPDSMLVTEEGREGNLDQMASDLSHCERLCRLHGCNSMHFCGQTHTCRLSSRLVLAKGGVIENSSEEFARVASMKGCQVYSAPDIPSRPYQETRLARLLVDYRHQDYQALSLPPEPEELRLGLEESGLSEREYRIIQQQHTQKLKEVLLTRNDRIGKLALPLLADRLHVLEPSRFEVESGDSVLSELGYSFRSEENTNNKDEDINQQDDIQDEPDLANQLSRSFREGRSMVQFRPGALTAANRRNRVLELSYDRCALACLDSFCSSFSHCESSNECILTDVHELTWATDHLLLQQKTDCFIMQRDFLPKFTRFNNLLPPEPSDYRKLRDAQNPSECAFICFSEIEFTCMAFEHCRPLQAIGANGFRSPQCYLMVDRLVPDHLLEVKDEGGQLNTNGTKPTNTAVSSRKVTDRPTGCDHYARSYLADFERVEFRSIVPSQLEKMSTRLIEGKTVDQCAENCATSSTGCNGFQFCFEANRKSGYIQSCILIDQSFSQSGPVKMPKGSMSVIITDQKEYGNTEQVMKTGSFIRPDTNCHLFSLRAGSSELANSAVRLKPLLDLTRRSGPLPVNSNDLSRDFQGSAGLSLTGSVLFYLSMSVVFSVIGAAIYVAKESNPSVRARFDRILIFLRDRF